MKIELQPKGPGRGLLRVDRGFDQPEAVALAVQRNDGLYLGAALQWQAMPHWHPQFAVQPDGEGLRFDLGPEILDGIIAVGGAPLRVALRVDGAEDQGILRIRGELIGSDAAAPARSDADPLDASVGADADARADARADVAASEPDAASEPAAEAEQSATPRHSSLRLWLLLLPLAGAAALGSAWILGLFDADPDAEQTATEPAPEAMPELPEPSAPEPAAALTGIALARDILGRGPRGDAVFARALEAEAAKDCAAALVLFNAAANLSPAHAAQLAYRYDPRGFVAGGCIDQPDKAYVIIYLADAAKAGDAAAQRRLGQLMTERERSGPTHEEGLEWLRKAAQAGDDEARRFLRELNK